MGKRNAVGKRAVKESLKFSQKDRYVTLPKAWVLGNSLKGILFKVGNMVVILPKDFLEEFESYYGLSVRLQNTFRCREYNVINAEEENLTSWDFCQMVTQAKKG